MTYTESCSCGASMTVRGFLVDGIGEAIADFRAIHAACRKQAPAPRHVYAAGGSEA